MKVNKIANYLEQYFPLHLQMGFDNCGLQVGSLDQNISKILVSLNMDDDVIDKAIENKCDMIITHHPLTISPIKTFEYEDTTFSIVKKAIENSIVIYSLHTCLDQGSDGISMNDWLINLFDCHSVESYDQNNIGKKAVLNNSLKLLDFVNLVQDKLNVSSIKFSGNKDKIINSFAICGGSASDDIYHLSGQVDVFITGDCKYHQGQFSKFNDIGLIDAGHHIEVIVEEKLKMLLEPLDIEVIEAKCLDYFEYM